MRTDRRPPSGLAALVGQLDADSHARAHYPAIPRLQQLREEAQALHARSRLRMTLQQAPAEGGPLNSAVLVHRMLQAMQVLSPGYLQHFVAYADTLSWLEQLPRDAVPAPSAAVGRGRVTKRAPASSRRPR